MLKPMAVCEGRHDIPNTQGRFFWPKKTVDRLFARDASPSDWRLEAHERIKEIEICDRKKKRNARKRVDLYVTGLTIATTSAIRALRSEGYMVVLWHYNSERNIYYPEVWM